MAFVKGLRGLQRGITPKDFSESPSASWPTSTAARSLRRRSEPCRFLVHEGRGYQPPKLPKSCSNGEPHDAQCGALRTLNGLPVGGGPTRPPCQAAIATASTKSSCAFSRQEARSLLATSGTFVLKLNSSSCNIGA